MEQEALGVMEVLVEVAAVLPEEEGIVALAEDVVVEDPVVMVEQTEKRQQPLLQILMHHPQDMAMP